MQEIKDRKERLEERKEVRKKEDKRMTRPEAEYDTILHTCVLKTLVECVSKPRLLGYKNEARA